ncbi:MAG: cation transporter [Rikenellaceae bacterium]
MKNLFVIALIAMVAISVSTASAKQKEATPVSTTKQTTTQQKVTTTTTQFITDIKTDKEAATATKKISSISGVENVDINLKSKVATVRYNKQKTNNAEIIKAFKKIKVEAKVKK